MVFSRWILLLSLFVTFSSQADETDPYSGFREQSTYNEELEVPWVELEAQVKRLPGDNDLVEAELQALPAAMQMHIDMSSVEIGEDDVTRAWLVVKSQSGAYNASYEGLRCADRSYKVYAYYNPKRSNPLRVMELPQWRFARVGNYRYELMEDYVCSGTRAEPVNHIAENLRKEAGSYQSPY